VFLIGAEKEEGGNSRGSLFFYQRFARRFKRHTDVIANTIKSNFKK